MACTRYCTAKSIRQRALHLQQARDAAPASGSLYLHSTITSQALRSCALQLIDPWITRMQMDRRLEESLESARRLQRSIDQQAEQVVQQAREGGSNIVIRQQEQRGNGGYS